MKESTRDSAVVARAPADALSLALAEAGGVAGGQPGSAPEAASLPGSVSFTRASAVAEVQDHTVPRLPELLRYLPPDVVAEQIIRGQPDNWRSLSLSCKDTGEYLAAPIFVRAAGFATANKEEIDNVAQIRFLNVHKALRVTARMMKHIGSRQLLDVANLYISGKLTAEQSTRLLELLQTPLNKRSSNREIALCEISPAFRPCDQTWGNETIIAVLSGLFTVEAARRTYILGMHKVLRVFEQEPVNVGDWPILPADFRRAGCYEAADTLEKLRTKEERQRFFYSCDLGCHGAIFKDSTHYAVRLALARIDGAQLLGPFGDFSDKETTDRVCRETFWPDGEPAPELTPGVRENEPTTLRSLGKRCTLF